MKLSIIIPSYCRANLLQYGLESLSKQTIPYSYEVIVLNDGDKNDDTKIVCQAFKNRLNIRYIFTGNRNLDGFKWRTPGYAINEGVRISKGNIIILSSPEIYVLDDIIKPMVRAVIQNPKFLVMCDGKDDRNQHFLKIIKNTNRNTEQGYSKLAEKLNTKLPFFMAIDKQEFLNINGYDNNFTGYCFDDEDLIDRLIYNGCKHYEIPGRIVHIYHARTHRKGLENKKEKWYYNRELYLEKKKEREIKSEEPKIINPKTPQWHLEKIPKIAHFYWGEKELPYLRYLSMVSFIKYNPDWEVRLYYPKYRTIGKNWNSNEHKFEFTGIDYYDKLRELPIKFIEVDFELIGLSNNLTEVYKANYLEYFLLKTMGGLFSDTDIIYFNSMNTLSINKPENKNANNVFSILWHGHTMGFLLASPDNEIYRYLFKKTYDYFIRLKDNYQCIGTLMIDREIGKTIEKINEKFPDLNIVNLLKPAIYAYDIKTIEKVFTNSNVEYFTKDSIGLHWYGGYKLSMEYINTVNEHNIDSSNVIGKVITASIKSLPLINNNELTIHSIVRNESLIYYSIKSVYPYAKTILLYDTGSNDKHTLNDIKLLLKEDKDNKIIFKQIPLDFDESKWTYEKVNEFAKEHEGKMSVGKVRQMQIEDTKTEFFMILDGDEVHYRATMDAIVNTILPNLDKNIIGVNIPLIWFYDTNHTFIVPGLENTGRIWRTDSVCMNKQSPNEFHCFKETGIPVAREDKEYLIYKDIKPYAHFETFIKPWRRVIKENQLIEFKEKLPEVIIENKYYINRYLEEKNNG